MSNYILHLILELKGYIILSVAAVFALTVMTLIFMGRKKQGMEDFGWQGLFFGRSRRELCLMAFGISQVTFVFSMVFFFVPVGTVQIAALAALCVAKGLLGLSASGFLGEVFWGCMTGAALMTGNLLLDYMEETGTDPYIWLIWALLSLFVLQYSIYFFIKGLERMLRRHEKAKERQRREHENEKIVADFSVGGGGVRGGDHQRFPGAERQGHHED